MTLVTTQPQTKLTREAMTFGLCVDKIRISIDKIQSSSTEKFSGPKYLLQSETWYPVQIEISTILQTD